ncbi:MAG: GNAT family N-acetyltransferase [Rhodospirillales bacterium]|nr:GNAT family N-acetyltransferase [Rhodospirillales bacterium]
MKADDIHIRQFSEEDWQQFRDIRLAALKDCEGVYLASYKNALNHSQSYWKETLRGGDRALFGLFDADKNIGLGSIFTWKDDPSGKTGILAMGYIVPAYRGQGFSKMLYEARINWAQNHPLIEKIVVSHRKGNEVSRRANQAYGFQPTGQQTLTFGNGQKDIDYTYVLHLKK